MKIKIDDQIEVIRGESRGQRGQVIDVDHASNKIKVEKLNTVKKAVRPSQANPRGGHIEIEMAFDASNVMLVCPHTNEPTRVGIRTNDDGSKVRFSKKSGKDIDVVRPGAGYGN
ncbi:MAG TPA: 50S ribosomal protein L24 [Planctomycetaceae bacterium]|jgi:large subunit ribosomal protein L24|nr:50S ribosomal protein L24 [Rhodopirellula sp.]MCH2359629.1 50S ribosomal protein L24 [Pirellulales bacterium]HAL13021.1 50S ribosomal protein L24 [Planctomycetaceae bacterium]MCH2609989.1 50S ribosomal protein L24 [Pirellulales bacterium]HCK71871.1 50S ribosomal protein L24 [Planctomycetaceae bacterium]|tara:strand:+ start:554 stop:895 length:342 start_codon:yes stop_codon:yes gene_type:complete